MPKVLHDRNDLRITRIFNPHVSTDPTHNSSPDEIRWTWITMTGSDAADFLHRLTTVNIKSLAPGFGRNGCFLTVQGKFRAYFKLWRLAADQFAFEFDAGKNWKAQLLSTIDQFTFSEKFTLAGEINETSTNPAQFAEEECRWIFPSTEEMAKIALDPLQTRATIQSGIRVCHQGALDYGRNWLTVRGELRQLTTWLSEVCPMAEEIQIAEIEKWRINQVRPRVDHEITDQVIPLEVGLTDAIAVNKGCYPGQEVIEKISTRGAAPRRLIKIQGNGATAELKPGISIFLNDIEKTSVEIGQLSSLSINDKNEFTGLAIVRKMQAVVGQAVQMAHSSGIGRITEVAIDAEP